MLATALLLLLPTAQAFLFGGGGGGCGCAPPPQPVCPPQQGCGSSYASYQSAPVPAPQYAKPSPGYVSQVPSQPSGYAAPYNKRQQGVKTEPLEVEDLMLSETEGLKRVRRDTESVFDPKCNSEVLKNIILENIDTITAVAKRQIQEAATNKLGGRIDVICSSGTFSYIVNTEMYCETEKEGTTCFAFRQSS